MPLSQVIESKIYLICSLQYFNEEYDLTALDDLGNSAHMQGPGYLDKGSAP